MNQPNPNKIIKTLDILGRKLETKNDELQKLGKEKSAAEMEYRIALAKKQLELKVEKYPATLIMDLSRGTPEVAKLKFKRDSIESVYDACKSSINSIRSRIEIGRSVLTWLRAEFTNK